MLGIAAPTHIPHAFRRETTACWRWPNLVAATVSRSGHAPPARGVDAMSDRNASQGDTPAARFSTRPPQPPRRRVSPFETAWRTAAAVLVVALLSAGFFALLHGIQRPAARPTPTATVIHTPTATPAPSPTVPVYLLPSAPLLPAGWTWYRDSTGHFQVPLAPGWGVGTFYGDWTPQADSCKYRIQFFPSGSPVAPGQASATYAPRLIEIDVNLNCPPPPWSIGPDQRLIEEPNPITVDGQPVAIWDNDAAPGEINQFAVATFHGHQYEFEMQSRDSNFIRIDAKVFQQMLHGFKSMGK